MTDILSFIRKEFGDDIAFSLREPGRVAGVTYLPTGISTVDEALGGGIAQGRIIEIYGEESSGKSALACAIVGSLQKQGFKALYVDVEYALNLLEAKSNGVDTDDMIVSQPETAELAMGMIEKVVRHSKDPMVIVLDSVASLLTEAELEGDPGAAHVGLTARLMSQMMRKLVGPVKTGGHVLIFINQLRMKIGVMFGDPRTTTGGRALKFYASQRLNMFSSQKLGPKDAPIGQRCKLRVDKNKVAPPFGIAEFDIRYDRGIDFVSAVLDTSVSKGIVKKAGGRYYYPTDADKPLGNLNGKAKVVDWLYENPDTYELIYQNTTKALLPPEVTPSE